MPYLKYGVGTAGWWVGGSTGSVRSSCDDLADLVNGTDGMEFNVPIIDMRTDSGMGTRFHLLSIGRFLIENVDIECHIHGNNDDEHAHWHIDGIYKGVTSTPRAITATSATPRPTPSSWIIRSSEFQVSG